MTDNKVYFLNRNPRVLREGIMSYMDCTSVSWDDKLKKVVGKLKTKTLSFKMPVLNIYTDDTLRELKRVAEADQLRVPYRVAMYIGQSFL